jgi:hypothetical protein
MRDLRSALCGLVPFSRNTKDEASRTSRHSESTRWKEGVSALLVNRYCSKRIESLLYHMSVS